MWLILQDPLLETHCDVVKKCCKQALTIEHLIAYKLHQRYQGEHLTQKQMEDVCEYLITEEDPSFVAMLISYQDEAAPLPLSFLLDASTSMNPTTWWKAVEKCGIPHHSVKPIISDIVSSYFFSIYREDLFKLWRDPH